jgi:hypothetical protein
LKTAGTNPIHNKQKKKAAKELDEDEIAFKAKQQAGSWTFFSLPYHALFKRASPDTRFPLLT